MFDIWNVVKSLLVADQMEGEKKLEVKQILLELKLFRFLSSGNIKDTASSASFFCGLQI